MTTNSGRSEVTAASYSVCLIVCVSSGFMLHILAERNGPGVLEFLVGAVFLLSGVMTTAGTITVLGVAFGVCRRTQPWKVLIVVVVVASAVVVVVLVANHLTTSPVRQYWSTNRSVLAQLITVNDQLLAISGPPVGVDIRDAQNLEAKARTLEDAIHIGRGSSTLMKEEYTFAHHAYLMGVETVALLIHNTSSPNPAPSSLAAAIGNNLNAALTAYSQTTPS